MTAYPRFAVFTSGVMTAGILAARIRTAEPLCLLITCMYFMSAKLISMRSYHDSIVVSHALLSTCKPMLILCLHFLHVHGACIKCFGLLKKLIDAIGVCS